MKELQYTTLGIIAMNFIWVLWLSKCHDMQVKILLEDNSELRARNLSLSHRLQKGEG